MPLVCVSVGYISFPWVAGGSWGRAIREAGLTALWPWGFCVCLWYIWLRNVSRSLKAHVYVLPHFQGPHSESLVTMETKFGERPNADASIPRLQSEAVASDLQELSLQPAPNLLPVTERKNGQILLMHRHNCVKVSIKWFVRGTQRNSNRGAGQSCK